MENPTILQRRTSVGLVVLFGLVFSAGFLFGRSVQGPTVRTLDEAVRKLTNTSTPVDYGILTKTWDLIQSRYVGRPIDNAQLLQGAVNGLVSSLDDPYSFYLNPQAANSFEDEINGKFVGIGAELGQKNNQIVVIAPLPDTPANRAGVQAGDAIVSVDGTATSGQSLDEVVRRIRGKDGTTVVLILARSGEPNLTLSIKREKITVKSVKLDYVDKSGKSIGVVSISSFTQTTPSEFTAVAQSLILKQPAALIIDLRNNPGGYLDAAVSVADVFLSDGPVVTEDFGNGNKKVTNADAPAPLGKMKVVVLVDQGSASAAEILAGALRDRLHAQIVGEKTFGKGSVQEIEELPGGSTVKLTVAHWLTPAGTSIDKAGIVPDVVVPAGDDKTTSADPQLARALELAATL